MAVRDVIYYPNPILRKVAKAVPKVDADIEALVEDMLDTMYALGGVGIAAPQIGVSKRVIVCESVVLINPEIVSRSDQTIIETEGCLSFPGLSVNIPRATTVTVKGLNLKGKNFEATISGQGAVCVQHEIDHLDGKVFIDYLSRMRRQIIDKKLRKRLKNSQKESLR